MTAWEGRPVELLDKHPVFLTMRSVRTITADGTEIRNYVNGIGGECIESSAVVSGGVVNSTTYSQFSSCVAHVRACNNIFYINDGRVLRYAPIGTGGGRCYTNDATNPNFQVLRTFWGGAGFEIIGGQTGVSQAFIAQSTPTFDAPEWIVALSVYQMEPTCD